MNEHPNQDDMVNSFKPGDVEGFNKLYTALSHGLFQHVNSVIDNFEEAEEITNTVFLKLWKQRGHFENARKVNVFLYKSASNACLDYLRRLKITSAKQQQAIDELVRLQDLEIVLDEDVYTENSLLKRIYEEIEKMPERRRIIFKMCWIDQLSNTEVAQQLGISEKTVRNLKNLAKKRLKALFGNKGMMLAGVAFINWSMLMPQ